MTEQKTDLEKVVRAVLKASVKLAGGNAFEDGIDTLIHSYTATHDNISKPSGEPMPLRHYHTLKHTLDIISLAAPEMAKTVDSLISSSGTQTADELATKYIEALQTISVQERKDRVVALGFSALFHDLVYHTDGRIHPEVKRHLLDDIIDDGFNWKPDGKKNSPNASAFAGDDELKLAPVGNERLSMIACEQFMRKSGINNPELYLQTCADIEATIPFMSPEYQQQFANRFNTHSKKLGTSASQARTILSYALDIPNLADLSAFNPQTGKVLDFESETRLHSELDHRLALGSGATALDTANACARDYWFLSNVVIDGIYNKKSCVVFRRIDDEERPSIKQDLDIDSVAFNTARVKALFAAARCAAAGLIIATGNGKKVVGECSELADEIEGIRKLESISTTSTSVLIELKEQNRTPGEYSLGNLDKIAELLLERMSVEAINELASTVSNIVVTEGSHKKLHADQIKENLSAKIPEIIKNKLATNKLDDISKATHLGMSAG